MSNESGHMSKLSISDEAGTFDVSVLEAHRPSRVVLFAVGGGGNPERYAPLLAALAERGCSVVAPHFERMLSPVPTAEDLLLRARRLKLALDAVARVGVPTAGVGHSIGATMLLALAGGQVWMGPGKRVPIAADDRIDRLALMAPATGFFQAPGALDALRVPVLVWVGSNDVITPPAQAALLRDALGSRVSLEMRVVEGTGHYSFLNVPPPQTTDSLPDRDAFLAALATAVGDFVVR
jgi:pimeloyl-ACP methyl ester carboxylesterase